MRWERKFFEGDFINFIGIAILAGLAMICCLAIIPMLLRKKDVVYSAIALLEALILSVAAGGMLGRGGLTQVLSGILLRIFSYRVTGITRPLFSAFNASAVAAHLAYETIGAVVLAGCRWIRFRLINQPFDSRQSNPRHGGLSSLSLLTFKVNVPLINVPVSPEIHLSDPKGCVFRCEVGVGHEKNGGTEADAQNCA